MRIVALITVRNEELYLPTCLRHLEEQGIDVCLIDNGSSDQTKKIANSFLGRSVFRIEQLPFNGYFDLYAQCKQQEALARDIEADWFIRQDADEIREAPRGWGTLREAIEKVDRAGFNLINFSEFVFVPGDFISYNFIDELRHYYFFRPTPFHHVKAWKKCSEIQLANSGGHQAHIANGKIFPEDFSLRHYIGLSIDHLRSKYLSRKFSLIEVETLGWHGWRAEIMRWKIEAPPASLLKWYAMDRLWDRSDPQERHLLIAGRLDGEDE